ncbi:MAG: G1 family glutamic endopeptidase [Acidimicrobiales bacterium]
MRRVAIAAVGLFAGLPALVVGGGSFATQAQALAGATVPSRAQAHGGVLIPKNGHVALPRHGGSIDSLNWSGYAVTASGINAVSSTFTVPTAGLVPPGFAATWTGIGGYTSSDLIQAGTAEQSLPGLPLLGDQYYAWYELLPGAEIQLTGCNGDVNCTVNPGDTISVNISQVGPSNAANNWSIDMADAGHWTWSNTVTYVSTNSSAEWILEAPSLTGLQTLLAPVGTVGFGPTSTFSTGGSPITVAQGNPTQIDLSPLPGVINEATPSALASDGQSFNVCA